MKSEVGGSKDNCRVACFENTEYELSTVDSFWNGVDDKIASSGLRED